MTPKREAWNILWLETVDSTNDEARRRFGEIDNMSVIAARQQTSGRGQGSHKWISEAGKNLTASIVLKYPSGTAGSSAFLKSLNSAVCTAICNLLEEEGLSPAVKEPNDIYAGGRKICGILIENSFENSEITGSIIGIGLNLNQTEFPTLPMGAVSMKMLTGNEYDPEKVLEKLLTHFERIH